MDEFHCPSALMRDYRPTDADPYPNLAWMRSANPISPIPRAEGGGAWLITGYQLGRQALTEPKLSLDARNWPGHRVQPGNFLSTDPPEHTRLRKLVAAPFSSSSALRWGPVIADICESAVSKFTARGSADLVAEYAVPVPVAVIHAFLGIPEEERKDAIKCMDYFFHAGFIDQTDNPARAELESYVRDLIAYKRKHPGADITTVLLAKQAAGEVHSEDELIQMMYVLLGAGHLSTVPVLSTAVLRLLQNPGQVAAHSAEPGFWSTVAEEVLRYDSAVQTSHTRIALDDVMIGDVLVRKGDTVTVSLAGANRDPEQFADPEAFDTRQPLRSHLAFGHGVHLCVGAHLARLEVQIALHTLFRRIPTLRLEPPPGSFTWVLGPVLRGVRKVPVTFEPS